MRRPWRATDAALAAQREARSGFAANTRWHKARAAARGADACAPATGQGAAGLAFLALCWWLVRTREAEGMERRAANPHGAEARVERRLMAEDAAYRLCRRASAAVLALPAPEGGAE